MFRSTYFCNVHREDDKVTKYVRGRYTLAVFGDHLEAAVCLARFVNRPETLDLIPATLHTLPEEVYRCLQGAPRPIFGDAYIVSTNGRKMGKPLYLCEVLLPAILKALGPGTGWRTTSGSGTLAGAYAALRGVYGLGSFMAGQILADLKNTEGHPLYEAPDWWEFAVQGPGSLRGVSWIKHGVPDQGNPTRFNQDLSMIREALTAHGMDIRMICNQDLQNCMCEFDKYCRVRTGMGRSKRIYKGV